MECRPVTKLPEGSEWVYELKLDGYRCQAINDDEGVRLLSRNGNDLTKSYPAVVAALAVALPPLTSVDGELVAFDEDGRPSFSAMQNSRGKQTHVMFYAFDLLILAGQDVTSEPLAERRKLLDGVYKVSHEADISPQFPASAERFLKGVREVNGEGAVAKKLTSRYEPGLRTGSWSKFRLTMEQEFVIGGFTPGTHGFDAVLLGFYRAKKLLFCASVRNGFVPASRRSLHKQLGPLIVDQCPFTNLPEKSPGRWGQGLTGKKMQECVWLKPVTVAQFAFLEWTASEHLRHVHFLRLRADKPAEEVVRET